MASYQQIRSSLPKLNYLGAIPEYLVFDVDTRFTQEQVNLIKQLISTIVGIWSNSHEENNNGVVPNFFQKRVGDAAVRDLEPIGFDERLSNGSAAVEVLLNVLTEKFVENGFGKTSVPKIKFARPKSGMDYRIIAANGGPGSNLSVTFNPDYLKTGNSLFNTGALMNAFMVRSGYRKPITKFRKLSNSENIRETIEESCPLLQ